jgi:hypothetical protein
MLMHGIVHYIFI